MLRKPLMTAALRNALLAVAVASAVLLAARAAWAEVDRLERVEANSTNRHTQMYFATGPCWIEIIGDGDTDLDLFVYDDDNNNALLRSDTGPTDRCRVDFNAEGSGTCTLMVQNLGGVHNTYRLRTSE